MATNGRTVTVFGGTGFLGRRIVRHLRSRGFPVRIASRHPDQGHRLFSRDDPQLQSVGANIHDERSVADALAGACGVVDAVRLYVEHGQETCHSVHVDSAQRVAAQAHRTGVDRLIHISGIGADAVSQSRYIRKRGEGELTVRAAFVETPFIRPAVMFGPDDAFLTTILKLLRHLPVYPMFGRGVTRLLPAYVEEVAEAIARVMQRAETPSTSSSAALASTLTRSFSEPLRTRLDPTDSNPACRLACTCVGVRNVAESVPQAQSSGTDADRHPVFAEDARIW
ncbi:MULTISPECIES: NAD(P)H-binding protein [unclassified Bradyrhizobium]|uniref:NAD(P)H-binding protein n=1 Tax=unclassified Bradyrhizobium TaxID=2631580 RepID=UPI002FF2506B